jgi:hypothetical protein
MMKNRRDHLPLPQHPGRESLSSAPLTNVRGFEPSAALSHCTPCSFPLSVMEVRVGEWPAPPPPGDDSEEACEEM